MKEKRTELERYITQMADDAQRIRALATGVSDEEARLRPDPDSWSILEVVNHLLDEEREESLAWLSGLSSPDWEAVYQAPWGPTGAGGVFAAWVAHDLLHTRQLQPYKAEYAGEW